jgi:D-psicose/D-tagatose/L-ribulose 3-epimerase
VKLSLCNEVIRNLPFDAAARGEVAWAVIASDAQSAGVTYCIEPLAPRETDFVNTVAEAATIVQRIRNPALRTMIDTSAAVLAQAESVATVIERWMPTGLVAHVQLNDRNRRGPGQGTDPFAPVLAALTRTGYTGWLPWSRSSMSPTDRPARRVRSVTWPGS